MPVMADGGALSRLWLGEGGGGFGGAPFFLTREPWQPHAHSSPARRRARARLANAAMPSSLTTLALRAAPRPVRGPVACARAGGAGCREGERGRAGCAMREFADVECAYGMSPPKLLAVLEEEEARGSSKERGRGD